MSVNPLKNNVLIRARATRARKYIQQVRSEFDQTQTVGTVIAVGESVPEDVKNLVGKVVYFQAFHEITTKEDDLEPEILLNSEFIMGVEEEK